MAQSPNFVVILTDQQRADHLGCYGNGTVRTPNIDAVAARGTLFENFYVSTPICMPNRAALLTSRMPSGTGAYANGLPLPLDANTFVWSLFNAGFDTALIGKAHFQPMTGLPAAMPTPEGIAPTDDEFGSGIIGGYRGPPYEQENQIDWEAGRRSSVDLPYYGFGHVELCTDHGDRVGGAYRRWARARCADFDQLWGRDNAAAAIGFGVPQAWRTQVPAEVYPSAYIAERAVTWLSERLDDRPFFLMCSFPDPHHPFTPPGKYFDMYAPGEVDLPDTFGRERRDATPILAALHQQFADGKRDSRGTMPYAVSADEAKASIALTYGMISMIDDCVGRIVKALSDTGLDGSTIVVFMSDHGDYMGDHGLMLKSGLHYRGLVRVPFVWADPLDPRSPRTHPGLFSALDFGPTVLARAGIKPFWGMLGCDANTDDGHSCILIEEHGHQPTPGLGAPVRSRTLVADRWRMSIFHGVDWGELYDLDADPGELQNLWSDPNHSAVKCSLMVELAYAQLHHSDRAAYPPARA